MTVGGRDRPDAKVEVPRFAALLERKALKGLDWHFAQLETEDHYTIDLKTFHSGLETLFSELIYIERMITEGADHAKKKLNALAGLYGFDESLPEETLVRMGYVLLNQERFEDAVTLFQINAEWYPDSYLSYENLGEAYMLIGQKELALQNFQKSLDLNTSNEYARQKLRELNE
jgi:tetratricopeptide (TPR) repeat protein